MATIDLNSHSPATSNPSSFPNKEFRITIVQQNVTVAVLKPTYYMRGWDTLLSQYEVWSGLSVNTPNPSGNPLQDITVTAIVIV